MIGRSPFFHDRKKTYPVGIFESHFQIPTAQGSCIPVFALIPERESLTLLRGEERQM